MISQEFRNKLESIMADWYAAEDAGEMTLVELTQAVREIAKARAVKSEGEVELTTSSGAGAGFMAGAMGAMMAMGGMLALKRPTQVEEVVLKPEDKPEN